jgi:hypothetical protein
MFMSLQRKRLRILAKKLSTRVTLVNLISRILVSVLIGTRIVPYLLMYTN